MARKVFVSSDMSCDERIGEAAETCPLAPLIWPYLLTWLDDWGRGEYIPRKMKTQVFPQVAPITIEVIEDAIKAFAETGLLALYDVNGKRFIAVPSDKWFKYQTHIRREKRTKDDSRFPAIPGENPENSAQLPEKEPETVQTARETDGLSEKRTKKQPSPSPSPSIVKDSALPAARGVLEKSFDCFWEVFRKHCGRDKQEAWEEWKKLKPDRELYQRIMTSLQGQIAVYNQLSSAGEFVERLPYACRWLRKRRWEDELNLPPPESETYTEPDATDNERFREWQKRKNQQVQI